MKMRKILSAALALIMVLSILPVAAFAANNGPAPAGEETPVIYVGTIADGFNCIGTIYKCDTAYNDAVPGITYNKTSNTLTLDNYQNSKACFEITSMGDDFKIEVKGVCDITRITVDSYNWGGSLSIIGNGKLIINKERINSGAIFLGAWGTMSTLSLGKDVNIEMYAGDYMPKIISIAGVTSSNVSDVVKTANGQALNEFSVTNNGNGTYDMVMQGDEYFYKGNGQLYPDVRNGEWYTEAVAYNAEKGFITGYKNGNFGPADKLQRQDFIVILARIEEAGLDSYNECALGDVDMSAYYGKSVAWAVANDIIKGYENGKFGVGDPITREQVAVILYSFTGRPDKGSESAIAGFADKDSISSFAKDAMIWAVNNGVITGKDAKTLAPTDTASRAEIATIITRMDQKGML